MTETTAIFLHIPKAAGMTLHRVIERQYRVDQIYSTYPTRRDPRGRVETFVTLSPERLASICMLIRKHSVRACLRQLLKPRTPPATSAAA